MNVKARGLVISRTLILLSSPAVASRKPSAACRAEHGLRRVRIGQIVLAALSVLLALAPSPVNGQQTGAPGTLNWSDSLRDVYINGELDRAAQVLSCNTPRQLALLSPELESAIVLNLKDHSVAAVSKEAFRLAPDHASAASDANLAAEPLGSFTTVMSSTYYVFAKGKPVLIAWHAGIVGEMSLDTLWASVPIWKSLAESYSPNAEAVRALKACEVQTELLIFLGTWCPDSRRYVPQLLKALQEAGNKNVRVKIIGINNQFHEPLDVIQQHRLTNVPTVIVEQKGQEVGRIVETPAVSTIEEELVAILNGRPYIHPGRWARGPLIARGTYLCTDKAGQELGREKWELYKATDGGRLLHSVIQKSGVVSEVWYQTDASSQATFMEVTDRRADEVARTRYYKDGQRLDVQTRGNAVGVAEQSIILPTGACLLSPAIVGQDWLFYATPALRSMSSSYAVSDSPQATSRAIETTKFEIKSDKAVSTPAGKYLARYLIRTVGEKPSEWWIHKDLNIPIKVRMQNGIEYRLISLEL